MFSEDNNGFINFPHDTKATIEAGKTLVYIVAFDYFRKNKLANVNLISPGIFISDDMISRPAIQPKDKTLDSFIDAHKPQDIYDSMYFPSTEEELKKSINLITCICVGWCNNTFEYETGNWNATFKDLTEEGKNLYYSIKKLHNNKEVRILTFMD